MGAGGAGEPTTAEEGGGPGEQVARTGDQEGGQEGQLGDPWERYTLADGSKNPGNVLAEPVPEPESILIALCGLISVGLVFRRCRKR